MENENVAQAAKRWHDAKRALEQAEVDLNNAINGFPPRPTTTTTTTTPEPIPPKPSKMKLGINLASITDWSSELVFTDAFKASRPWTSQAIGKPYGEGGPLNLTTGKDGFPAGWVKSLQPNQFAEALMFVDWQGHIPLGSYQVTWEGHGEIECDGACARTRSGISPFTIDVNNQKAGFLALRVWKTSPTNPVRNIRVWRVGFAGENMYPSFVNRWKEFTGPIRFMDWLCTGNDMVKTWADRNTIYSPTQANGKGVALEYCIYLAMLTTREPWVNVPMLADNDYVYRMAELIKGQYTGPMGLANAGKRIWVEYSNECWNHAYPTAQYCRQEGMKLGVPEANDEAMDHFYVKRSLEVFQIFKEVFGSDERLIRVLNCHADNPWRGQRIMDAFGGKVIQEADAIAIAPYWGHGDVIGNTPEEINALSVKEIADKCLAQIWGKNKRNIETYRALTKDRGLKLVAYEGGQHLVGIDGKLDKKAVAPKFLEANRSGWMRVLYEYDLRQWQELGGEEFCLFSSVGKYVKPGNNEIVDYGFWGLLEWWDQETSPKMEAVMELLK